MSSILSISLFCGNSNEPESFVRLLRRLLLRSKEISGFAYKINLNPDRRESICISDNMERYILRGDKNNSFRFRMLFSSESNRLVPIDVMLHGNRFDNGILFRDSGPIRITAAVNDLSRPLWELIQKNNSTLTTKQESELSMIIQSDIKDLFFTVCGIYDDSEKSARSVRHGLMYLEYGCPSPVGVSMIYHQKSVDFLNDYQRIYDDYRFGKIGSAIYSPEYNDFASKPMLAGAAPHSKRHPKYYQQFDPPDGVNILRFLESLTTDFVLKVKDISPESVLQWLFCYSKSGNQITFYHLHDDSIILSAFNPLSSLWKCYASFYDDMLHEWGEKEVRDRRF